MEEMRCKQNAGFEKCKECKYSRWHPNDRHLSPGISYLCGHEGRRALIEIRSPVSIADKILNKEGE